MIPYGRQEITDEDVQRVVDVLKSDYLTQGPVIDNFEREFADYCGAKYAVAVSSCTAALHISCLSLNVGEGDILWTVPNTFVASANCGLYCNATIDFVDIDPDTWNISIPALEKKLVTASRENKLPKAIVPVHFSGRSCDMRAIKKLSEKYGFAIIEDAAHSIGASYENEKVGSCAYADLTCFSTHPVKIITTGEGGIVTTNDEKLYKKLLCLRTHGITRDPNQMTKEPDGPWYFEQIMLGYHYRMTDLQAALGLSQMGRVDKYVDTRRQLARRYHDKLRELPLQLPQNEDIDTSSWHIYVVRLQLDKIAKTQKTVFDEMRSADIGVNLHYIPVHFHPYYQKLGFKKGDFPQCEQYYREALTLPLYPGLTHKEQDYICDTLRKILA